MKLIDLINIMAILPLTDEFTEVQLTLLESIDEHYLKEKILWDSVGHNWAELFEKADKELKKWYDRKVFYIRVGEPMITSVSIILVRKNDKKKEKKKKNDKKQKNKKQKPDEVFNQLDSLESIDEVFRFLYLKNYIDNLYLECDLEAKKFKLLSEDSEETIKELERQLDAKFQKERNNDEKRQRNN